MIILERGEQLQAHHVAGDLDRVGLVIVARLARLELVEAPATTVTDRRVAGATAMSGFQYDLVVVDWS
jgi:hypothetical protein